VCWGWQTSTRQALWCAVFTVHVHATHGAHVTLNALLLLCFPALFDTLLQVEGLLNEYKSGPVVRYGFAAWAVVSTTVTACPAAAVCLKNRWRAL
jgi:hypothetical protein